MKKIVLFLVSCFLLGQAFGQLSGTKTVCTGGDYPTIAAAVTALNASGVGAGGVTFNVCAGHTESSGSPITINSTVIGTSGNPIVFQKSGSGANPLVTRTDAGSNTTSGLGGLGDAVIRMDGTDYITFDGIDLTASNQGIEYGYFTFKPSATNGCQNVTIKNANITMTKGTSAYVIGIYLSNGPTSLSSATGVTVTAKSGQNQNVIVTGNTIQNVHAGIYSRGSSATGLYDNNIVIGQSGAGNILQNFGGGSATTTYGVYFIYVTDPTASYNIVNNAGGGGTAHGSILYGIYFTSVTGNVTGNNNTVTLANNSATSSSNGIYTASGVTSITFNNNTFSTGTLSSTGSVYLICASSSTPSVTITGNQTSGTITRTGASGTIYCYYNAGGPASGLETITNNNFSNITVTGISTTYGIYSFTATGQNRTCSNNTISNWSGATGAKYGLYLLSSTTNQINNNTVTSFTAGGNVYGLYFSGTNPSVYQNSISNLTTTGATLYGIYDAGTGTTNCYRNQVFNLNSDNTNPTLYGFYVTTGTSNNVYNNFGSL